MQHWGARSTLNSFLVNLRQDNICIAMLPLMYTCAFCIHSTYSSESECHFNYTFNYQEILLSFFNPETSLSWTMSLTPQCHQVWNFSGKMCKCSSFDVSDASVSNGRSWHHNVGRWVTDWFSCCSSGFTQCCIVLIFFKKKRFSYNGMNTCAKPVKHWSRFHSCIRFMLNTKYVVPCL